MTSRRSLVLRPCAKVNLNLRVGARRADGYHDVRTVLQSIALHDTLRLTERPGPFALATRSPGVPADRSNLIWRAADHLWRSLRRAGDARDVHVRLDKTIPPAAGLGGGSADAAAALVGLNRMWGGRLAVGDLMRIGAELGADVPFFLHGGTALGTGRGDELYPIDDVRPAGIIVVKPSFGVATADAYRWLDEARQTTMAAAAASTPRPSQFVDVGWTTGPLMIANDLQPPVSDRQPAISEILDALLRQGAIAAAMTGSGSAVFGIFGGPTAVRTAARRLQRPDWLVCVTRTLGRRETRRLMGL